MIKFKNNLVAAWFFVLVGSLVALSFIVFTLLLFTIIDNYQSGYLFLLVELNSWWIIILCAIGILFIFIIIGYIILIRSFIKGSYEVY